MCEYVLVFMYACTDVCVCACIHVYMCACLYACMLVYTRGCVGMHVRVLMAIDLFECCYLSQSSGIGVVQVLVYITLPIAMILTGEREG